MVDDLIVTRTALRVLRALCEQLDVNNGDVHKISKALPDVAISGPLDRLAWEAIQRALRDREAKLRGKRWLAASTTMSSVAGRGFLLEVRFPSIGTSNNCKRR